MNENIDSRVETSGSLLVRPCRAADLPAVQAIYAHHVLNGVGTFEETPPDLAEMTTRHAAVVDTGFPYLVAADSQGIAGFAYAARYRARSAYRYTAEDSIYVAPDRGRRGVGRALLVDLIERCTAMGCRQMIAVVGGSENTGSIALHRALGFEHVGKLGNAGFKFGRWRDSVLMQRPLGDGAGNLPE